jgi:hypothetical protein
MPSHIETEARITAPKKSEVLVAALSDTPPKTPQAAGYNFVLMRGGQQQLHETDPEASEHIFYPQTDVAGAKLSGDEIALVTDAANLKYLVQLASREREVAEKKRLVELILQTRVELDGVKGLGSSLKLEVARHEGKSPAEAHAIVSDLMQRLGFKETGLISAAYAAMLIEGTVLVQLPPPRRRAVLQRLSSVPIDRWCGLAEAGPARPAAFSLARLLACRGSDIVTHWKASAEAQRAAVCLVIL